jgi:hypothetical protein
MRWQRQKFESTSIFVCFILVRIFKYIIEKTRRFEYLNTSTRVREQGKKIKLIEVGGLWMFGLRV